MGPEATRAVLNLGDIGLRIFRTGLCEVTHRCLFLAYWSSKHTKVATECSRGELLDRAKHTIDDLSLTPEVPQRFKQKSEDLDSIANHLNTWVELAVLYVVGEEEALVALRFQPALGFHRRVTDRAGAQ